MSNPIEITTATTDLLEATVNSLAVALRTQNRAKEDRAMNAVVRYLQTGTFEDYDVYEYLVANPVFANEDDFERAGEIIARNEAAFDLLDEVQLERLAELVIRAL